MKWIKSGGGPLICVQSQLASSWHGILGSAKSDICQPGSVGTDYDRACRVRDYLGTIDLPNGSALILGDMPLETSVWATASGGIFIVRLFYLDPGTDVPHLLRYIGDKSFDDPEESISFYVGTESMVIFDAAFSGSDSTRETVDFAISRGNYRILTKTIDPDERTSLLVHRFYLEA